MSKQKKVGFWRILCDALVLAFGGILLGLLALPHILTILFGNILESVKLSGYDLINFEKGSNTAIATILLLLVIFASLLCLFAILKLLSDFNVIKNRKFSRVVGFLMAGCALILLVLAIANIIAIATNCQVETDKLTGKRSGTIAGFGALFGSMIAALGAMIASFAFVTRK